MLSALHSPDQSRKNTMIRESLSDLRDIINDNSAADLSLEEVVSDLRAETAEHCAAHDIQLDWSLQGETGRALPPTASHALRSVMREIVSNTIKHAEASTLSIAIVADGRELTFMCQDNGKGFDPMTVKPGNGLENLQDRLAALGGELATLPTPEGVTTKASFPLARLEG